MAQPGTGAETYVDDFVYACKHYTPKLFLVECAADRSGMNFWFPTNKITNEGYKDWFAQGINGTKDYTYSKIFQESRVQALVNQVQDHQLEKFKNSKLQAHSLKKLLKEYVNLIPYNYNQDIIRLRTEKIYNTLETLSELVNVPILYYRYWNVENPYVENFTKSLGNRLLSEYVFDWAKEKLNGNHLADSIHLNPEADTLLVNELLAPFISNYLNG
jgi:hypothetical protein